MTLFTIVKDIMTEHCVILRRDYILNIVVLFIAGFLIGLMCGSECVKLNIK
jgi:hypothetical protein